MTEFEKWWQEQPYSKNNNSRVKLVAGRAFNAAIEAVIAEWEKPYGLTDGRTFIERLRGMKG